MPELRKCCTSRSLNSTLILKKSAIKRRYMSLWSHIQQLDEGLVANQLPKLIMVTVGGILMTNRSAWYSVHVRTPATPAFKTYELLVINALFKVPSCSAASSSVTHLCTHIATTPPRQQLHPPIGRHEIWRIYTGEFTFLMILHCRTPHSVPV